MSTLDRRMAATVRQDVQSMHGYAIQPSAGFVKLDAMENPFRLPLELQRELGERLGRVAINRYPSGCVADVIATLSRYVELPAGCKLMLGNGSDELISLLAMACDRPGNTILAPLPGFVMYEMSAKLQGLGFVGVPTTKPAWVVPASPAPIRLAIPKSTSRTRPVPFSIRMLSGLMSRWMRPAACACASAASTPAITVSACGTGIGPSRRRVSESGVPSTKGIA